MIADDDFMEAGDSGLVPLAGGWWLHKPSGNKISPEGKIYDNSGSIIGEAELPDDNS